ncbi:hypothetical protein HK099_003766 [Clydaea vesicula]|uniref:Zn(2)-C6 fungal-type domain-containing protein n=1 Tax=Clydaea vesicula TaxID=447962 RepID=A0AAD5U1M2_9FUNG|nr:hypothetical protein HK099_003766 [Clydaea vesicula]
MLISSKKKGFAKRGTISSVACEDCRTAKRKCDSASPKCSSCVKLKKDCVYRTYARKSKSKKATADSNLTENISVNFTNCTFRNSQINIASNSCIPSFHNHSFNPVNHDVSLDHLFDFSGLFYGPLPNPVELPSFITEIESEDGLVHFLNEQTPSPSISIETQLEISSPDLNEQIAFEYLIFKVNFAAETPVLCFLAFYYEEFVTILKQIELETNIPIQRIDFRIFKLIRPRLSTYVYNLILATGCLKGCSTFLFSVCLNKFSTLEECCVHYLEKAEHALQSLNHEEKYNINALQAYINIVSLNLYFGKSKEASQFLTQEFNWDSPYLEKNQLQIVHEKDVYPRCKVWGKLIEISSYLTPPLLIDETSLLYLCDLQFWLDLGHVYRDFALCSQLHLALQLVFLYRKAVSVNLEYCF